MSLAWRPDGSIDEEALALELEPSRVKTRAHSRVHLALKKGLLIKQPCEVCGETRVHAHHDDYDKPLKVRWLCPLHHRRAHSSGVPTRLVTFLLTPELKEGLRARANANGRSLSEEVRVIVREHLEREVAA